MDHEAFAGGHVIEQLAEQVEVGAVAFFVGLADVFGVPDQAPEHHPDPKQLRVHYPRRERAGEERVHLLRGRAGLLDFLEQGSGQLAGDLLVGVGNQRINAAEMVVEQPHGHAGLGGDAAHGNAGVTVAHQAAQGRGHQHFASLVRLSAAVFRGGDCHKESLGVLPGGELS
ncbi:hypothetical protein BK660_03090 [Pseudomonas brassicacearum]|uniref:Uncharacterized protein n=1 Tax=Pseudomonas brassicacearum TaxID=930166 RepID=A0A423IGW5_9PSED|nr:hypothetical protein BK660_03090 [Pseudomonas brassicacearum]